jgi:outer membrane protein OmpU
MITGIGYVDADAHDAGGEVVNDAEVHVNYRLTADNGLQFGAKVEFEANGTSENADEYVAWVAGNFGRVEIGREDGAGDRLLLSPPGCALSCVSDTDGFLTDYAEDEAGDAMLNENEDTGDELKITYFSPTIAGFRAGASFVPGSDSEGGGTPRLFGQGGTSTVGSDVSDRGAEVGARWDIDLGGMMGDPDAELALSGAWFGVNDFEDHNYSAAFEVDLFGFGFGARYSYIDPDSESNLGAGVQYSTGPWVFGVNTAVVLESDARENDFAIGAEANYALAPGVAVSGIVEYADYDFKDPTVEQDGGFAVGVLMELAF